MGARAAGLKPVVSVDVDPTLTSSYSANFPRSNLVNADLMDLDPVDLRGRIAAKRLTAIVGGPPCQGFSVMGRRHLDDPRNDLLRRYFEYVAVLEPRFFLMENVPGLFDSTNKPTLDAALSLVPSRYKVLEPTILDAADFGAATSRPRLVVVGYDPEEVDVLEVQHIRAAQVTKKASVRDAIADLSNPTSDGSDWLPLRKEVKPSAYARRLRKLPPKGLGTDTAAVQLAKGYVSGFQPTNHTSEVIERFRHLQPGQRDSISKYPRLTWDKPAYVLRAGTGSDKGSFQAARPIHPEEPRVITVREAARIQGFPDWFQFHATKWHSHRMIGNSVSPVFAEAILRVILSKLGMNERLEAAE